MIQMMLSIDRAIFFFFQRLQRPWLDWLTLPTFLGEIMTLLTVVVGLIMAIDKKAVAHKVTTMACGLIISHWVYYFLKEIFKRPRPFLRWENVTVIFSAPDGYSFPSGHATAVFTAAFLLNCLYPKKMRWTYALAAWVALTRVYVGVHYFADILGGCIIGIACAYFTCFILKKLAKEKPIA